MKNTGTRREIDTEEIFHEVQPHISFPPKFLCFHAFCGSPKELRRFQSSKIPMFSKDVDY
jgi:hypothetical protein